MLNPETMAEVERQAKRYQPPLRKVSAFDYEALDDAVIDTPDHHRNAPKPDQSCLYGLVGEVARAGSRDTEANPFAIAANFIVYMSAAIGRGAFTYIGNTRHHCRINALHVGRTGRGRKGDAASLIHRLDMALRSLDEYIAPQVHSGGLSTREGLALMIHDGWSQGKNEVEPIHDKRLWVIESEFANVLMQSKRDGNTLSAALRDCWDGVSIKPATKGQPRVWASHPHVNLSAAITGNELHSVMASRELTNGFANRFLIFWAERTRMLPFPKATPQHEVEALAQRVMEVIRFAGGDRPAERDVLQITMSKDAQTLFAQLYLSELNDQSAGETVTALLERRAPTLRRLAMLFAICELNTEVNVNHITAALAWIRYWADSVKFIFSDGAAEAASAVTDDAARQILDFLANHGEATRKQITVECFGGHKSKSLIDKALDELLVASPAKIEVKMVPRPKDSPGTPTKIYLLAANCANSANSEYSCGFQPNFDKCEPSELCELSFSPGTTVRTVSTVRDTQKQPQTHAGIDSSHSSHSSHANSEKVEIDL